MTALPRPATVTICGQPFTVKWEERAGTRLHEDSDSYWDLGTTVVAEQTIVIRTLQGQHQMRETLLHEVLHAIVNMTSQRDRFKPNDAHEKHPEEPVVAAMAVALAAVLRENRSVVDWLTEAEVTNAPQRQKSVVGYRDGIDYDSSEQ